MKADEMVKGFESAGYQVLATNGNRSWFNLLAPDGRSLVQLRDSDGATDPSVVMCQATIAVRGFMGEIKTWWFNLPNDNFGKALEQINKIDRMFQMHLGEDGNINDWNF